MAEFCVPNPQPQRHNHAIINAVLRQMIHQLINFAVFGPPIFAKLSQVAEFCALTGADPGTAAHMLEAMGGDLEQARGRVVGWGGVCGGMGCGEGRKRMNERMGRHRRRPPFIHSNTPLPPNPNIPPPFPLQKQQQQQHRPSHFSSSTAPAAEWGSGRAAAAPPRPRLGRKRGRMVALGGRTGMGR